MKDLDTAASIIYSKAMDKEAIAPQKKRILAELIVEITVARINTMSYQRISDMVTQETGVKVCARTIRRVMKELCTDQVMAEAAALAKFRKLKTSIPATSAECPSVRESVSGENDMEKEGSMSDSNFWNQKRSTGNIEILLTKSKNIDETGSALLAKALATDPQTLTKKSIIQSLAVEIGVARSRNWTYQMIADMIFELLGVKISPRTIQQHYLAMVNEGGLKEEVARLAPFRKPKEAP